MRHDDILFHLNKAAAEGDLSQVKQYAVQWKGKNFGKPLGHAVEGNHVDVVDYLLTLPIDPNQISRALEYAIEHSFIPTVGLLAEHLDEYYCGCGLVLGGRLNKLAAVEALIEFSPPHFILMTLCEALLDKKDDLIALLGPLSSLNDVAQQLSGRPHGQEAVLYYAQWREDQRVSKVLHDAVQPAVNTHTDHKRKI